MSTNSRFRDFYDSYKQWHRLKKPFSLSRTGWKLAEECGEVAEALAALDGSKSKIKKIHKKGQTVRESLSEELGDVIRVVLNIATLCNIPHDVLFSQAHLKNIERQTEIIGELEHAEENKEGNEVSRREGSRRGSRTDYRL